ncbi:MAG: hypothetical protein SGI88_19545 [Candidatus Hydrogenedentes bacterium]|nr:hypothetical protein [Candidatus Hydrogenedentota bacterium]
MFRALSRWFKAFGYLVTGQLDSARRVLDTNPQVVRAKYDEIIREKTTRIHQYKQAVAGLISQQVMKMAKLKELTGEVTKLENLKSGALAKAKHLADKMIAAGKSQDDVKSSEEYKTCLNAFNDFSSTLAEKQARIDELEKDVEELSKRISDHKIQLKDLHREIDKVRVEASDAIADMLTAKEEKDIADSISGISQDRTSEELQRLRHLREEVKAEARISREMAGTNTRAQESEFLEYARKSASSSEFDQLIGLAKTAESSSGMGEAREKTALPE